MKKKQLSKELLQSLRFYDYLIYDPTSKSFSIKKYGETKALELAIDFRNSKLDQLKDSNIYFDESHYATL